MKKISTLLLSLVFLLSLVINCYAVSLETEPNNDASTADPLICGEPTTGQLSSYKDEDWFSISTSGSDVIHLSFDGSGSIYGGWDISIIDSSDNILAKKSHHEKYDTTNISVAVSEQGIYYVVIKSNPYLDDDYIFTVSLSNSGGHNAVPSQTLGVVNFPASVTPANNQVQVGNCNDVMIQPTLSVPSSDVGKTATLIMYIYLPDANFGINIPSKTKVLTSETKFDLLPNAIDFSTSANLNVYIYYGYMLGNNIKYNAYSVGVGSSCEN